METEEPKRKNISKKNINKNSAVYIKKRQKANARKRKYLDNLTSEQRELKKAKDREYYQKKKAENKIKSINDMTEREKRKQRSLWKINSRKYRQQRKNSLSKINNTPPLSEEENNIYHYVNTAIIQRTFRHLRQRQECSRTSENSSPKNEYGKSQVLENKNSNANDCISIIETSDLRRSPSPSEGCSGFQCDECYRNIYGFRFTCVQCSDWDLCGSCEWRGMHATHYLLRVPRGATQMESREVKEKIYASLIPLLGSQTRSEETPETTQVKEEYSEVAVTEEVIEDDDVEHQDLNFYPDALPHCPFSLPPETEVRVQIENMKSFPDPLEFENEMSGPDTVHVEQISRNDKLIKSKAEDQNRDSKSIKVRGGKKPIVQENLIVQQSQSESTQFIEGGCGVSSSHGGRPKRKKKSAILGEPSGSVNIARKPNPKKRKK